MSEFSIEFNGEEKKIPYTTDFKELKKSFAKAFNVDGKKKYVFNYHDNDDDINDLNEDSTPSNFIDAKKYKIIVELSESDEIQDNGVIESKENPDSSQGSLLSSMKAKIFNNSTNFENSENIVLSEKKFR